MITSSGLHKVVGAAGISGIYAAKIVATIECSL
jgi:hypothetical protein